MSATFLVLATRLSLGHRRELEHRSAWAYDQHHFAQKAFSDTQSTFDKSRLREFLLQHGIVSPKSPIEDVCLLAEQIYRACVSVCPSMLSAGSRTQAGKSLLSMAYQVATTAAQASKGLISLQITLGRKPDAVLVGREESFENERGD